MGVIKTKKEIIREAAIDVIAENGFDDATIEKIAKRAKVAVGTVYNYFNKKEDILDYIFQVEYEKRVKFLEQLKTEDIHPLKKIRDIMTMHFAQLRGNPNLAKVILKERSFIKQNKIEYIRKFEELPNFIKNIIENGINKGLIRKCDSDIISIALFGSVEALMTQFIIKSNGYKSLNLFERAADEIWNLLRWGLESQ